MATYGCDKWGMAAKITCAKCDLPLFDARLQIGHGRSVQVSQCPSYEGKIKSSSCCGEEMTYSIQMQMKRDAVNPAKPQATFHRVLAS